MFFSELGIKPATLYRYVGPQGPVARARREGPRPLNRSALDRDAGGHVLNRRISPPPANNPICPSGCTPPVRGKALRDAWNLDSADRAARVLARLAGSLERDHPVAAASIREGLDETLTVQRLGLTGARCNVRCARRTSSRT